MIGARRGQAGIVVGVFVCTVMACHPCCAAAALTHVSLVMAELGLLTMSATGTYTFPRSFSYCIIIAFALTCRHVRHPFISRRDGWMQEAVGR